MEPQNYTHDFCLAIGILEYCKHTLWPNYLKLQAAADGLRANLIEAINNPNLPMDLFENYTLGLWPAFLKTQTGLNNMRIDILQLEFDAMMLIRKYEEMFQLTPVQCVQSSKTTVSIPQNSNHCQDLSQTTRENNNDEFFF